MQPFPLLPFYPASWPAPMARPTTRIVPKPKPTTIRSHLLFPRLFLAALFAWSILSTGKTSFRRSDWRKRSERRLISLSKARQLAAASFVDVCNFKAAPLSMPDSRTAAWVFICKKAYDAELFMSTILIR